MICACTRHAASIKGVRTFHLPPSHLGMGAEGSMGFSEVLEFKPARFDPHSRYPTKQIETQDRRAVKIIRRLKE